MLSTRPPRSASPWPGVLLALPLLAFLAALVAWPLGHLAARAFTAAGSVLISLAPAWVLARERFPGRDLLRTAISLPLTFSGVLVGFLMVVLLGRIGAIPVVLELLTGRAVFAGAAYTFAALFAAYLVVIQALGGEEFHRGLPT